MLAGGSAVLALWLFCGGGIWLVVGAVGFAFLVFLGEDVLCQWAFFISIVAGVIWLFFKAVKIEL